MAHPTRNERLAIAQRRIQVADLYMQGLRQIDIAGQVGVSIDVVGLDLKAVRKEWEGRRVEARDRWVAEQLARIDHIERLATAGWQRSCGDAQERRTVTTPAQRARKGVAAVPKQVKEIQNTKGQAGDPRFLERMAWCVEQRLKIVGGYAQPDGDASGGTGMQITVINFGLGASSGAAPVEDRTD